MKLFFQLFALGDVAVDDDQLFHFPVAILTTLAVDPGQPASIFMADAIFHRSAHSVRRARWLHPQLSCDHPHGFGQMLKSYQVLCVYPSNFS